MQRHDAVIYLLKAHVPKGGYSTKYGTTELARAIVAWNAAVALADTEDDVTTDLLNEIILSVDRGDAVIGGLNGLE